LKKLSVPSLGDKVARPKFLQRRHFFGTARYDEHGRDVLLVSVDRKEASAFDQGEIPGEVNEVSAMKHIYELKKYFSKCNYRRFEEKVI